jgi:hypothetical protein
VLHQLIILEFPTHLLQKPTHLQRCRIHNCQPSQELRGYRVQLHDF